MIFVADSSAWIDFLRFADTFAQSRLSRALAGAEPVVVPGIVLAEVLAGTHPSRVVQVARMLDQQWVASELDRNDYRAAAALFRDARRRGRTVRGLADCLVAQFCLRHSLPLLARDRDFESLAAVSSLQLIRPDA